MKFYVDSCHKRDHKIDHQQIYEGSSSRTFFHHGNKDKEMKIMKQQIRCSIASVFKGISF